MTLVDRVKLYADAWKEGAAGLERATREDDVSRRAHADGRSALEEAVHRELRDVGSSGDAMLDAFAAIRKRATMPVPNGTAFDREFDLDGKRATPQPGIAPIRYLATPATSLSRTTGELPADEDTAETKHEDFSRDLLPYEMV